MFDKFDKPEIIENLKFKKNVLLNSLIECYNHLFFVEHEKCNHFKREFELMWGMEFISDINDIIFSFDKLVMKNIKLNRLCIAMGISMMPTIMPGDIIFIKFGYDDYKVGDIVLGYECSRKLNIIHKITKIRGRKIITKGVNNDSTDLLSKDTVFGKIMYNIKRNDELHRIFLESLELQQEFIDALEFTLDEINDIDDESMNDNVMKEKDEIQKMLSNLKQLKN